MFVHYRSNTQIGINFVKGDLEQLDHAGAGFNVETGDVIKVFIVDEINNELDESSDAL